MDDILFQRVHSFLATHQLLRPSALLVVAVSGGPDSLALLHMLTRVYEAGGPRLYVAHLDHGFRGEQSAAEARFVAATAAAWSLPATVERRDVPAVVQAQRENALAAARRIRYQFLADLARSLAADAVAVAHQADDQAETVLLHLLRGAGPAGLRGMRPVVPWNEWAAGSYDEGRTTKDESGNTLDLHPSSFILHPFLIRPLLTTTRAEIAAYCAGHQLAPTDDPSNRNERAARVRMRRLMPTLAAENPRLVEALGRTAAICADDYAFILSQLDTYWPKLAEERPGELLLRRAVWANLPPTLQRYALRRANERLDSEELSQAQIEAARDLIAAGTGRHMQLTPHVLLEVDSQTVRLSSDERPIDAQPQLGADLTLPTRGTIAIGPGWDCLVQSEAPAAPSCWWVALDPARLTGPVLLRRRRPGDRFRPAGGRGSRKLQDFFVDVGLPRRLRDAWPILATPTTIVWVAGLRADERHIARAASQDTIWVGLVKRK